MNKYVFTLALICLVALGGSELLAQGPPPPPGSGNAPFGFVELLIAGGAALGGKKLYDKQKAKKEA